MDCVYKDWMRRHRVKLRKAAVEGIPEEKRSEHLSLLSRLHKFLIILLSMQLKDESTEEELYYKVCQGYTTSESFLGPLRHFSYTRLFHLMENVFGGVANGMNGARAESFLMFCLVSHLLYDGSFPINYEGLAFQQVLWKKLSIAAIVDGRYIAVPVDTHVERFFKLFARNDEDIKPCIEMLRVRLNPKIGRYTNDFIAEFGQIFNRGTGSSVEFAITVLRELKIEDQEYADIIDNWLSSYKSNTGYNNIMESGGV